MKIATYNAASVRARLPYILDWVASNDPDILAIQETKVEDSKFPREDFEELGYHVSLNGQKSWNGVATISKVAPTTIWPGFQDDLFQNDARILTCLIEGIPIVNTYVPNGNTVGSEKWEYKMKWLEKFAAFLRDHFKPTEPLVWLGDINIARKPEDVYDSPKLLGGVGHHPDEFARLDAILAFGLSDAFRQIEKEPGYFTYWDFTIPNGVKRNLGWRIDHIYLTDCLLPKLRSCTIDKEARMGERPSDHTYVVAELSI